MTARTPLTHARIIDAAVTVADAGGLTQVSMRNVGRELGVEAMSLYHHVAGKSAMLDGMVDWIFRHIRLPDAQDGWRQGMILRAESARRTLASHPWALGLVESRRTPVPALLRHHDAVLACLRRNGFSVDLASHTFSAIDAYVYGFVLTELNLPFDNSGADAFVDEFTQALPAAEYPYLAEVGAMIVRDGYRFGDEFPYGLDLILDSVERRLTDSA